ncbi:MAG: HAMP domain-containing sensor histidine kinase [Eubacteriales bacterium]|nr:HAMP domain-containing sensor histidine kinase [Eubacteriales bacterium]
MFNRSRRKIILSIMSSLILLFVVTISVIMAASFREIRQRNAEMLARYAQLYDLRREQGSPEPLPMPDGINAPGPGPADPPPDYQLSTFYSVALAEDGSVLAVDNGEKALYEEEELIRIAEQLLSEGRPSGRVGNLSYAVSRRADCTLVAFLDDTVTQSSMSMLLHNVLLVGGAAIVVLFFLSLHLSKRIIRPLEENDRSQKRFVSDASHELKTPVAVIGANAELLSRELGENEWLANIRYENERMGELVRQLLELSRAENAETPMEQLDLSRVVTGEVLAFESLAFEQGKTIESEIEDGIRMTGNRSQLAQLVSVLLDNAVRHAGGGEIGVTLRQQAHTAVLSVVNEGDEIPPDKLEHLFDRFYRLDEARSGEGQHYGLGLSIAKAVAEKHGGSIGVTCADGKVRFTVSLPAKK